MSSDMAGDLSNDFANTFMIDEEIELEQKKIKNNDFFFPARRYYMHLLLYVHDLYFAFHSIQ